MENDEKAVKITTFINPYQFWYHGLDDESYIEVRNIEEELTKYYKCNFDLMLRDAEIVVGSEIAVRYLPRNKFIRVRVEEKLQDGHSGIRYILWAIDHGFAFKSQAQFCRYLPEKFKKKIERVRRGGIENVVPAGSEFNFLKQKLETLVKDKWCKRACDSLSEILSEADSIEFVEHFCQDGQYWGDLVIFNQQGSVQHASDFLINQNVAVRSVEKFKKSLLFSKRYLISTWQTNDGNNNYKNNISPLDHQDLSLSERKIDLNDTNFQNAQIKVAAWNNFNKNAEQNSGLDGSVLENIESDSVLYDDVDDSVSNVAPHSPASVKRYLNSRELPKKHNNELSKKVSPVPTPEDFGISENSAGESIISDETSSNVPTHNRSQYLRFMRLKHLLAKPQTTSKNCNTTDAKKGECDISVKNDQGTRSCRENKFTLSKCYASTENSSPDTAKMPQRIREILANRITVAQKNLPNLAEKFINEQNASTKTSEINNDQTITTNSLNRYTLPSQSHTAGDYFSTKLNDDQAAMSNRVEKCMLSFRPDSSQVSVKSSEINALQSTSMLYADVDDSVSNFELYSPASIKQNLISHKLPKKHNNELSKKVPPVPTLEDFGIPEDDAAASMTSDETSSNVSTNSRSQYLRCMRLKHLHEKRQTTPNNCNTADAKKEESDVSLKKDQATTSHMQDKLTLPKCYASTENASDGTDQVPQRIREILANRMNVVQKNSTVQSDKLIPKQHASTKMSEINADQTITSNSLEKCALPNLSSTASSQITAQSSKPKGDYFSTKLNDDLDVISNRLDKFMLSHHPDSSQSNFQNTEHVLQLENDDFVNVSANSSEVNTSEAIVADEHTLPNCSANASSDTISNASSNVSDSSKAPIEHYLHQLRIKSLKMEGRRTDETLSETKLEVSKSTLSSNDSRKNVIMFPAGFDLANLNKYNNKDHWHCKETTRNEYRLHHDQDFCFNRANIDKRKTFASKCDDNSDMENIRPLTVNASSMTPNLEDEQQKNKSIKNEENDNAEFSDTDVFLDVDEALNNDDSGSNSSCASSITSMYSAKSSLTDSLYSIGLETLKMEKVGIVQKQNTNRKTNFLGNFIKKIPDNVEKAKWETPKIVSQPFSVQQTTKSATESDSCLTGDRRLRLNYFQHAVLAHAAEEIKPIESINRIALAPDVRDGMISRGLSRVSRTQSYAWPHMLQGKSLFVINPPDSCKTWCYIPTLCTAIIDCLENELAPNTNGPLAIVLVASSDQAIQVSNHCVHFLRSLKRTDAKTVCSFGVRELVQTKILLMEGCAILVATPPNFRRLLEDNKQKDPLFSSRRLRHIIIDDVDVMMSRSKDDITLALKSLYTLAPKVKDSKKLLPQLVVTSRSYIPVIENLIKISNQPLLVIGDFLEAAVYGKAKICFEICAKTQKMQRILEFIKEHPYKNESLMILCNRDEDVFAICEQLQLSGIDYLGCHSDASPLVRQKVHNWKLPANTNSKVLVCTDSILYEFEIQNVQNVIHYSLACMWAKMKFRFSVHKEMYENLVKNNFADNKSNKKLVTSFILLDEENNEELPRIVEFLKSHNQLKYISQDVIKLSKHISIQREKERCKANNQFCDLFFEYGECDKQVCRKRHSLTEDDIKTAADSEPLIQSGDLRILVLNVFSPTHYAVRLLEHRSSSAANWICIKQSDKAAAFALKLNFFYANSNNLNRHWPIRVNDICVIERHGSYRRARVLEAPILKSENVIKSIDVTIKLIDDGDILTEKSDDIYACHEQFKNFPAQSSNMHLIGLRPLDNETSWDADTIFYVKGILMHKLQKNESVCASVSFSTVDTIVVRNLFVMKKLPTLGHSIITTNFKRDMVNKSYALLDENAEKRLQNIIKSHGLEKFLSTPAAVENDDTKTISDQSSQSGNEDIGFNMKKNKTEEFEQELPSNISKKHKSPTVLTNDNSEDILKPINSKAIKSRNEFIRNLKNKELTETIARPSNIQNDTKYEEAPVPKLCSVLEFLQIFQHVHELEAEDLDLEGEGMEQVREYYYQTDQLCKLEIRKELERQSNKAITATSAQPPQSNENYTEFANKEMALLPYKKPQPQLLLPNVESEVAQTIDDNMPPSLKNLHKRPRTSWYETNHLIILSIYAPDIDDYYLEVEKTFLYFMATVNGVDEVLVINFLGTVEPQYTSHEIRGLNVIVRLVKSLFMPWPRLIKQEEKMPWLSYNLNMLNVEEMENLLPQRYLDRVLHNKAYKPYESDDESYESNDDLQTYTHIQNTDDLHDPINAECF